MSTDVSKEKRETIISAKITVMKKLTGRFFVLLFSILCCTLSISCKSDTVEKFEFGLKTDDTYHIKSILSQILRPLLFHKNIKAKKFRGLMTVPFEIVLSSKVLSFRTAFLK